jgi:glycosyltransferase involved in cell wall biosynthesis
VVTVHDVVPLDHPEWLNPRFAMVHRWLLPRIVRRAAHVITVSQFTRSRLIEHTGIQPEKVSAVYNGADSRFCPQPPEAILAMRAELGLPGKRYVLALGSIEPRKNMSRLLDAWRRVVARLPDDLWLVIAGARGRALVYRPVLLNNIPARVHFTGHVPDRLIPALYSGATVFAYLSMYEGFGLPPLEAMACGVPVITGNRTSLPEVIGDGGTMVNPFDIDEIAAKLEQLVSDEELRRSLAARGLERSELFSWQKASDATLRILSEVAAS